MSGVVGLRARAEVRERWRSLLALALLVGLAGGAALTAVAGARRTVSSYDRFRHEVDTYDVVLQTIDVDDDLTGAVLALPQVADSSRVAMFIGSAGGPQDLSIIASGDGRLLSAIHRPRVLAGRLPDPTEAHEVAVPEQVAELLDVGVGDTVTFETFTPEELQELGQGEFSGTGGPTLELGVVGVTREPSDLQGVTDYSLYGTRAFYRRYLDRVGNQPGIFAVDLRANAADLAAFESDVAEILRDREWGVQSAANEAASVRDALRVLAVGLVLFAACAGLAGTVVAGQAGARHLAMSREDQPVLAALGMTRAQRAAAAFVPAAVAAVAGAVLAGAVAVAASPFMPIGLARRAEPDPGVSVDGLTLGPGVVAIAVLVGAWAAGAAWRMSGRRNTAPDPGRARPSMVAGWLARAGSAPAAVTGVRMAFEAGRGRTAVPVRPALVGAVTGVASVLAALTFAVSLDDLVATPARWGWNWDLAPDPPDGEEDSFAADPDIADLGRLHSGFVRIEGDGVQAHAVEALEGAPSLTVVDGRSPGSAKEVALGPETLDRLGLGLGDTVEAQEASGSSERRTLTIVGSALFPAVDNPRFADGAGLTVEGFGLLSQSEDTTTAVLTWALGVDEDAARRRLESDHPGALSVYSVPHPPGDVNNLAQVDALPRVLAGFLVLLAVAAIGHAVAVAVRRRRRDLAVLRAVGFLRRQVLATVAWQGLAMATVGVVVGIPLGLALGRWTWVTVADGLAVVPDPVYPVSALVAVLPAALLLTLALSWLPGRAAARIRPAVALRAE